MEPINTNLKKIIFKKLNKDLSHVEIILHDNESIWFIDRNEKYWYFELKKSGRLWWRYDFFINFFRLFSMNHSEFEPIISEWVEQVLNRKVDTTHAEILGKYRRVEQVLNRKVDTTVYDRNKKSQMVEQVLNRKVDTTRQNAGREPKWVEQVLNRKVDTTAFNYNLFSFEVEQVLNRKVDTTDRSVLQDKAQVEQVLNRKVDTTFSPEGIAMGQVEQVLNRKVDTTYGSMDNHLNIKIDPAGCLGMDWGLMVDDVLNGNINQLPRNDR
jgi:hypothetical protein